MSPPLASTSERPRDDSRSERPGLRASGVTGQPPHAGMLADRSTEWALLGLMVFLAVTGLGAGTLGDRGLMWLRLGSMLGALLAWGLARRTRQAAQLIQEQMSEQQATMARQMSKVEEQKRELERTRDEALRAAQVKDTFLATMSHELRTPLNAVIGVAGLLGDSALSEQQREFVDIIGRSSRTLHELIGDILDMSKLEAGRLEPEESPFDLLACVDDALELVATQAQAQHLELVVEVNPTVPRTVVSDVGRLRQILANLLSNAVKFTPRGEIVVRLDAEPIMPDHWRLQFEVSDTGIGIPADRLDRLFLPFSQVDSSTTREYGGTGLGLVISRALAELLGGQMSVRSEPGLGSTFFFSITAREPPERGSIPSLSPRLVLVVDDHARARAALASLARRLGAEAVEAASAPEARAALSRGFEVALVSDSVTDLDPALVDDLRHRVGTVVQLVARGTRPARGALLTLTRPVRLTALEACLRQSPPDLDPPSSVGREPPAAERAAGSPPARLRILVVEDNAINRKVLLKMLERLGHQADAVDNGVEALAATERKHYQVLLLDVNMPQLDGYSVAAELVRRHRRGRRPRIIGVTANALPGDREKCLAAGMDDYLPKPIEIDALGRTLDGPTHSRDHSLNHSNILDPTLVHRLRESTDHDQRLLQVCHEFLGEGEALLQTLLEACARRDVEAAQRATQGLLRGSREFGAVQLSVALLGVELLLLAPPGDENTEQLTDLCQRLRVLFDRTEQAVLRLTHSSSQSRIALARPHE